MGIDGGIQQDSVSWPQASDGSAMLQNPSFVRVNAIEGHGGSAFQRRQTCEVVREKLDRGAEDSY